MFRVSLSKKTGASGEIRQRDAGNSSYGNRYLHKFSQRYAMIFFPN